MSETGRRYVSLNSAIRGDGEEEVATDVAELRKFLYKADITGLTERQY